MNARAKMSSKGQIVVPKEIRDARGWGEGMEFDFVDNGKEVTIRPARQFDPRFPPITWEEFEAAETADARFAKSLDRVQPVMANLMSGGGTWKTYDVTFEQLESRVGVKIAKGAPGLWDWVREKARGWFD